MKRLNTHLEQIFKLKEMELGRTPRLSDFKTDGPSSDTYKNRFGGTWKSVLSHFNCFKKEITKEDIKTELLKITKKLKHEITQQDFRNHSSLCSLDYIKSKIGTWNSLKKELNLKPIRSAPYGLDEIYLEAQKYKTRNEFCKKSPSHYGAARRLGVLDAVCKHMTIVGSKYLRAIYAFEFDDKSVYVGLTYNYEERYRQHLLHTKTLKLKAKKNSFKFIKFNKWYLPEKAGAMEGKMIATYRRKGFVILNKIKHGGLGGSDQKWTKHEIVKISQNCKTKKDFRENYPGAYQHAFKHNFLNETTQKLVSNYNPSGHWTKNRIIKEAKKYKYKKDFKTKSRGAYGAAVRLGIIDQITMGFEKRKLYTKRWDKQSILNQMKSYNYMSSFRKDFPGAVLAAQKLGIFDEIKLKMKAEITPGFWDADRIKDAAQKCKNKTEFLKKYRGAYAAAKRLNIFEDCCAHMK